METIRRCCFVSMVGFILIAAGTGCAGGGTVGTGSSQALQGVIRNPEGLPLVGAEVTVRTGDGQHTQTVQTDETGSFSVSGIDVSSTDVVTVQVRTDTNGAEFDIPTSATSRTGETTVEISVAEEGNSRLTVLPDVVTGGEGGDDSSDDGADPGEGTIQIIEGVPVAVEKPNYSPGEDNTVSEGSAGADDGSATTDIEDITWDQGGGGDDGSDISVIDNTIPDSGRGSVDIGDPDSDVSGSPVDNKDPGTVDSSTGIATEVSAKRTGSSFARR